MKMFTHSSKIPVDFALTICAINNNEATYKSWELIDYYISKGIDVMSWIKSILIDNNTLNPIEKELEWWKSEIFKIYN
jgi:hypothetical protein